MVVERWVQHAAEALTAKRSPRGIMIVRSGDKKSNPVEVRQTDRQWLAKTVLLELHGHPRATWPEAWEPT